MLNLNGLLPFAFLGLAIISPGPPSRVGLPIRYSGEGGIVEVPLSSNHLGWMPRQSRDIIVEAIRPAGAEDGPDGEVVPEPVERARPLNPWEKAVTGACFDLWMFGDLPAEKRKVWMLSILSEKIVAAREGGLSAAEEEKLILAGRGDVKRFFDRVEAMRLEFEAARKDYKQGRNFLHGLISGTLPSEFESGPFGDGSLFAKTLAKIENDRKKSR